MQSLHPVLTASARSQTRQPSKILHGLEAGARLKANKRRILFAGVACMASSREALAPRASTTLDVVRQILGTLAARNHADEVLTCVRQIPAREATFRPLPEWVRL